MKACTLLLLTSLLASGQDNVSPANDKESKDGPSTKASTLRRVQGKVESFDAEKLVLAIKRNGEPEPATFQLKKGTKIWFFRRETITLNGTKGETLVRDPARFADLVKGKEVVVALHTEPNAKEEVLNVGIWRQERTKKGKK